MTPLVLDTSVIFKWSRQPHEEPLVPQALALLDQYLSGETDIRVPELLFYELGNTIKQKRHLTAHEHPLDPPLPKGKPESVSSPPLYERGKQGYVSGIYPPTYEGGGCLKLTAER
jgi:hypothetical protein